MTNIDSKSIKEHKEEMLRENILNTAEKLFNEKGLDKVSMKEIADEVLLSRATLYNYYGSKDSLQYAIIADRMKKGNDQFPQLLNLPMDTFTKLIQFLENSFDMALKNPVWNEIFRKFMDYDNSLPEHLEITYLKRFDENVKKFSNIDDLKQEEIYQLRMLEEIFRYEQFLFEIISRGQVDSSITTNHRPEVLAYFIIFLLNGLSEQLRIHVMPIEKFSIDRQVIKNLFIKAVESIIKN